jgi:hypothetical protein
MQLRVGRNPEGRRCGRGQRRVASLRSSSNRCITRCLRRNTASTCYNANNAEARSRREDKLRSLQMQLSATPQFRPPWERRRRRQRLARKRFGAFAACMTCVATSMGFHLHATMWHALIRIQHRYPCSGGRACQDRAMAERIPDEPNGYRYSAEVPGLALTTVNL